MNNTMDSISQKNQTTGYLSDEIVKNVDQSKSLTGFDDESHDDHTSVSNIVENSAENPMMDRVQLALREQLLKTYDRVKRELLEQEEGLKKSRREREDSGVQLYGLQQQLAALQNNVEITEREHSLLAEKRLDESEVLKELKKTQNSLMKESQAIKKKLQASQSEQFSLNETIRQIKRYNEEVKSEIAVTKRHADKAEEAVKELEKGKQEQDTYIDSLNEQIKRLESDVSLTDERIDLQEQETTESKALLQETFAELDQLIVEKKFLVQQWKSSIVALNRRDEALSLAEKDLKEAISKSKEYKTEAAGLEKEINNAKAKNETLNSSKEKFENELKFLEETILNLEEEKEILSQKYEMLQQSITRTSEEESAIQSRTKKIQRDIASINYRVEATIRDRHAIEEQIGSSKHEQASFSKATKNLLKQDKTLLQRIHGIEIENAGIQNELARVKIDALNTEAHNTQLQEKQSESLEVLTEKDSDIERLQTEIRRRNDEIEKKMNQVDKLNRKYNKMVSETDEPECLGPLEATIKSLGKSIEKEKEEVKQIQRGIAVNQSKLVQTISETDSIQERNIEVNAKLNILTQKKVRVLNDIHLNECELKATETNINGMHKDMILLNDLINKNTKDHMDINDENRLREKEFIQELKDIEADYLDMDAKITNLTKEKDEMLESIIHTEKKVLEWEKNIQLEKETRSALDSSEEVKEMKGMEKEIHRMKHHLEHISREQEKMIREMENAIHKKEDIAVKYSNRIGCKSFGSSLSNLKEARKSTVSMNTITNAELKKKTVDLKHHLRQINNQILSVCQQFDIEKCVFDMKLYYCCLKTTLTLVFYSE